jgi:hypothetical protein
MTQISCLNPLSEWVVFSVLKLFSIYVLWATFRVLSYILPLSPNICRPLVQFCTKGRQIFGDGGSSIEGVRIKVSFQKARAFAK